MALGLCIGLPSAAFGWLEGADPILARADAMLRPGEAREVRARILDRDGSRRVERWRLGGRDATALPSSFEREMLRALFDQGVQALATRLAVDRKERRMALVEDRPTQVIGQADRAAIWIDHRSHAVLRIVRGPDDLRLLAWDITRTRPTPHRLEYAHAGQWRRVTALEPVAP